MNLTDEVFAKAIAIQERWGARAVRYQWRMDRATFDAIFEATLEYGLDEELARELGLQPLIWEQRERNKERRRLHADAWGKPDNMLVGWPIVCDDMMVGFEPEVVLREPVAP